MKIEWAYLPQPHVYISRLEPRQLADLTWVLMSVPINKGKEEIGSQPIPDNPGHVPYCGDDGWVWVRKDAPELTKDNGNPLVAEMERRCAEMILVSQAVVTCADVFEQACTPRPPKAEWFEKWPRWWITVIFTADAPMGLIESDMRLYQRWDEPGEPWGFNGVQDGCGFSWRVKDILDCVPVAKEGYPAPVGWKVVGE